MRPQPRGRRAAAAVSTLATATALTALGGCLAAPGAAGAGSTGQSAQAITGGVNDNEHRNIVGIVIQGGGLGTCTGTLLLPNLVLTARHCVAETSQDFIVCSAFTDPGTGTRYTPTTAGAPYPTQRTIRGQRVYTFLVTTEANVFRAGDRFVGAEEVLIPSDARAGTPICGRDIALLRLAEPITEVEPAIPRLDLAPVASEPFIAVGYGVTSASRNDSGQRRVRRDGVEVVVNGPQFAARDLMVMAESEFLANTGTCQGDSGGPALEEIDGKNHVFGVLSRGDANSCDSPIYTRVDSYSQWIRDVAREAAASGGFEAPDWVDPPSEGSARLGQVCRGDTHCASPLTCRTVVGAEGAPNRRLCVDEDCSQCSEGYLCGDTTVTPACVPDPSYVPPMPTMMPGADAGAGGDGGMTGSGRGGCAVAYARPGEASTPTGRFAALSALGALALAFARRARKR